ncbi:MAG: hypothetical protein M1476_04540 [Candidatus Thermoplasmatota archaeon]|nr:hypothetical protein [Candidatus Thermoplasmatota archaeon]
MPQAYLGSGVIILGARNELPPMVGTLTPLVPFQVAIGTISALALAEVLASGTNVFTSSTLALPGAAGLVSGVKQECVFDCSLYGSGSIMFSLYSLQPTTKIMTGTLAQTDWIDPGTGTVGFRMFNSTSTPLSPLISVSWIPSGTLIVTGDVTMTFR